MSMLPPSLTPEAVHRNKSVEMLMNWKDFGTSTKSDTEVNHLVDDVLLDPNFKLDDLRGFNAARENQRSDTAEKESPLFRGLYCAPTFQADSRWNGCQFHVDSIHSIWNLFG